MEDWEHECYAIFFAGFGENVITSNKCGDHVTVEDLYQVFKYRLLSELRDEGELK
jgi:hypothetical protein